MGNYTILSQVSEAFLTLLRTHLVPEVVPDADGILLCSPGDKGDASLGIHLYDVQENDEYRVNGMMAKGEDVQAYPSAYLNLYYMVTAYSSSDAKYRMMEEQRILGRVVQVVRDHHTLSDVATGIKDGMGNLDVQIEMIRLDTEEKMKLWNMANQPYKLSLFYKVSPVELESMKEKRISRVGETIFTSSMDEGGGEIWK